MYSKLNMSKIEIPLIIDKIAKLQHTADRRYFPEGVLPSYRENAFLFYRRPDTNIFFTAITVFTLNQIKQYLPEKSQKQIGEISEKAIRNYPLFQNKDGLKTYNFFQTKPSRHFPNGYLFKHFEHFRIPDDIDDTAFIYLTSAHSKEDAEWLQQKLILHSNNYRRRINNTFPHYKSLKAYSTWFGKNMYIEFDACVMSNMLYCQLSDQLVLDEHGKDCLRYIQSVILKDEYLKQPFRVAHQYPKTSLIIYHVTRLMAAFPLPELEICRNKIVEDTLLLLRNESLHLMDKLLLETSLLRINALKKPEIIHILEQKTAPVSGKLELSNELFKGFYFFIAGFLTAYENPVLYKLASSRIAHFTWQCEAHNWTLVSEYLQYCSLLSASQKT